MRMVRVLAAADSLPDCRANFWIDFSYATVNLLSENELRVDFIRSSTGEVLDTSTLYKSHGEQFVVQ